MPSQRLQINLGKINNPLSPQFQIKRLRNDRLRTKIEGYLTIQGVEIDRAAPPTWFVWLDDEETIFQARCGEPEDDEKLGEDDQPYNYLILAKITRNPLGRIRAVGLGFYHEDDLDPVK